jgi:hypothetical protein
MAERHYLTAQCSVCGRNMRLCQDGTIGPHGAKIPGRWPPLSCDGWGQPPAGAVTDAE